ncbi:MAG TPA: hypothetical protein VF916_09975 [Ktedonobacterales bacterium]
MTDAETGEVLASGCPQCWSDEMPCKAHKCYRCDGSGLVCPTCCGDRFVYLDVRPGHPQFGEALRCRTCCPGNDVDSTRERTAIRGYLLKHPKDAVLP